MIQAVEPQTPSRQTNATRTARPAAQSPPQGGADFAQTIADVLQPNLTALTLGGPIESGADFGRTPAQNDDPSTQGRSATRRGDESNSKKKASESAQSTDTSATNLPDPSRAAAELLKSPVHPESVQPSSASNRTDDHDLGTGAADTPSASARRRSQHRAEAPASPIASEPSPNTANSSKLSHNSDTSHAHSTGQAANAEHQSTGAGQDSSNNSKDAAGNTTTGRSFTQPTPTSTVAIASSLPGSSATSERQGSEQTLKSLVGAATVETTRAETVGGPRSAANTRNPEQLFAQSDEPLIAQLGRGLTAALRQKGGSILIRLAPEALGQLRVHLTLDNSQVAARIETSTPEARDLLIKSENDLRAALEARGLQVKSVEIVNTGGPSRAPTANDNQPSSNSQQQQPADTQHRDDHKQREHHAKHEQRRSSQDEREHIGALTGTIASNGALSALREEEFNDGWTIRVDMTA